MNVQRKRHWIFAIYPNNIYNPDKIKADTISQHFGISQNYLGRYFKKHTNETMQQYIIKYKLKLVENRLLHSEMRINEIAAELGFTDESHLNKLFKNIKASYPLNLGKGIYDNYFVFTDLSVNLHC